jgi:poly(A)-specific ribonuclease
MEAIQDSGKPAVGHNLAFDLSYSLHSFAQELPGSWDEYKGLVGRWFPGGVYDTKHLSGTCAALRMLCCAVDAVRAVFDVHAVFSVRGGAAPRLRALRMVCRGALLALGLRAG